LDTNPTKRNLLLAKQNHALAIKGFYLIDMKYRALNRELKRKKKAAKILRESLLKLEFAAENAVAKAIAKTGFEKFHSIWENILWESPARPAYKLNETNIAIDEAFNIWLNVLASRQKLAAIEEEIARIKARTHSTRKRAAALKNIKIPQYERRIKYITEQLEERERDEISRLKVARESHE